MRHFVIMPEDCYKSTSERLKGQIVRKTGMGVEICAGYDEYRYIVSDFSPEAIEQAWLLHTCNAELILGDDGRYNVTYIPKPQKFKIVEYA